MLSKTQSGSFELHFSEYARLQGLPSMLRPKPNFIPATNFYLINLALISKLIFIIRKRIEDRKVEQNIVVGIQQVVDNISVHHAFSPIPTVRFNNNAENPEVTTSNVVARYSLIAGVALLPTSYLLYFAPISEWWTEFQYWMICDFMFPFLLNFIYPLFLYAQNDRLRKYLLSGFRD